MTKFIKSEITRGEYAMHNGKFVARFKRGGRADFISFLCKNFTVEEYFAHLDKGLAPMDVLYTKGYVSANVRKVLLASGYAPTSEGQKQYIDDQIKIRLAR